MRGEWLLVTATFPLNLFGI